MTTEQNKAVVRAFVEAINGKDWRRLDELVTPDFARQSSACGPPPIRSRDQLRDFLAGEAITFPDACETIHFMLAEGDMVVHRQTRRFKPKGIFRGNPPTDKEAIVGSVDIYRIVNGRIIEQWSYADRLGMMHQLDNFPMPAQEEPSAE